LYIFLVMMCIEGDVCFGNRCCSFWFGNLRCTVCTTWLRQVYDGIILCMILSLNYYFLALVIYYSGWKLIYYMCENKVDMQKDTMALAYCIASQRQCIVLWPTEVGTLRPSMLGCGPHCRQPPQVGVTGRRRVSTQAIPVCSKKVKAKSM
jgi:hypothetical protein